MSYEDPDTSGPPPPSYDEAVNSAPPPPSRPEPPLPSRPAGTPTFNPNDYSLSNHSSNQNSSSNYNSGSSSSNQNSSSGSRPNTASSQTSGGNSLYSNNPQLPYEYPKGYFCNKCKNTGFKVSKGTPCSSCWKKFAQNVRYQPNPNLPFRYPKGFICKKCRNSGKTMRDGRRCDECYGNFMRRNNIVQQAPNWATTPMNYVQNFANAVNTYRPPPALQVAPGDPRLGGVLCFRCGGSGRTLSFLFDDLCPACGGLGRLVNVHTGQYR